MTSSLVSLKERDGYNERNGFSVSRPKDSFGAAAQSRNGRLVTVTLCSQCQFDAAEFYVIPTQEESARHLYFFSPKERKEYNERNGFSVSRPKDSFGAAAR